VISFDILKKISRIHSVQFHNIVPEECLGKIISFKIDQSVIGKGMVMVSELLAKMTDFQESQVIMYDDFKVIIKEKVSATSFIVDFIYNSEEYFDTMTSLLLSYVEIGS